MKEFDFMSGFLSVFDIAQSHSIEISKNGLESDYEKLKNDQVKLEKDFYKSTENIKKNYFDEP